MCPEKNRVREIVRERSPGGVTTGGVAGSVVGLSVGTGTLYS